MAIKQIGAIKAMEVASEGKIMEASLSEISGGWLALAETLQGRKLVCAVTKECQGIAMFKAEAESMENGIITKIMGLNSNNAAALRRLVKWTGPTACGTKGLSIGFSDWLGCAEEYLTPFFSKKQIKPVLVEYTPADCSLLQRNFLEAIDAATWAVFATGYKEGYAASATRLTSEEDLVKALLYGYSMLGLDFSDKINLEIEGLTDLAVEERYLELPQEFRDAVEGSYLAGPVKAGNETLHYTPAVLRRIVLEYGEVIMHAQSMYNSYLKNTPWDIDFELFLSKKGKAITPEEHYLVGYELTRNKVKLTAIGLDAVIENKALQEDIAVHAAIAEACDYRLSIANADLFAGDFSGIAKVLKGRVYFKFENVLWLSALQCIGEKEPALLAEMAAFASITSAKLADIAPASETGKLYAGLYGKLLSPADGNFAAKIKAVLNDNSDTYREKITIIMEKYLKSC
ncbi:MAG: tagaturonate epimerase family protein [Acidaminococcaceae bacterium]